MTPPVTTTLDEHFDRPLLDSRLRWLNEPADWGLDPGRGALRLAPAPNTDFWQKTHYGFAADSGHFLYLPVAGDFVMTTHVGFHPRHQYDQAGLMVRLSPDCWLKTSVEHEPGEDNRLGAVVTNHGYSDWSTQSLDPAVNEVRFRVRRTGSDFLVESSRDGRGWTQLRLARLLEARADATVDCGLYACSPKGSGFVCDFLSLRIA